MNFGLHALRNTVVGLVCVYVFKYSIPGWKLKEEKTVSSATSTWNKAKIKMIWPKF